MLVSYSTGCAFFAMVCPPLARDTSRSKITVGPPPPPPPPPPPSNHSSRRALMLERGFAMAKFSPVRGPRTKFILAMSLDKVDCKPATRVRRKKPGCSNSAKLHH